MGRAGGGSSGEAQSGEAAHVERKGVKQPSLRSDQDGAEHPAQPTGRQRQDQGRDWQGQQGGGARRLWHLRDARPTHRPGQHEPRGDHRVGWLRLSAMFHKGCTKLAKFTEKFSCKSVKMKCMEMEQELVEAQEESLQIAILKFCRDRDTIFIDDVMS